MGAARLDAAEPRGHRRPTEALIDELVRAQRDDGGWSLEAMGPWRWSKTAPPVKSPGDLDASLLAQSDGYATGLVVYTLKQAGVAPSHAAIRKGIRWLETNQRTLPCLTFPAAAGSRTRSTTTASMARLPTTARWRREGRAVAAVVHVRYGDGVRHSRFSG